MIYKIYEIINYIRNRIKHPIGQLIPFRDMYGQPLHVGDTVKCKGSNGIILFNPSSEEYEVFISYSQWYGKNIYNPYSYGKSYTLTEHNLKTLFVL